MAGCIEEEFNTWIAIVRLGRKRQPRRNEFAGVGLEKSRGSNTRVTERSGVGFAAAECEIDKVPDADGERDSTGSAFHPVHVWGGCVHDFL